MSKPFFHNVPFTRVRSLFVVTTLLLLFVNVGRAQTTSITDGSTPSALTPGSPAGTYNLSGFENVNLFNGNLNFALPMLRVGGRGSADLTMMLTIEQHWRVRKPNAPPNCELTGTCDMRIPWPGWWASMNPDYGPGVLQGRKPGVQCGDLSLTRLTFSVPGGTEFELRDQLTNGQPLAFACGAPQGASRGTVFVTSDGSAATFVSDTTIFDTTSQNSTVITPSGFLMLRDGTRYRIDAGKVTWMRDRNGNKLTFTYSGPKVISITDSLNRQVNIAYSVADVAPYGTCDQITFKGFGGAQRMIRVSKTSLANALRTTRPGDPTTLWTFQQLFPELNGSATSQYNPTVVSSLWLPDGQRRYRFYYNVYGELARVELPTGGAIEYDFANANNPYDGIYRRVTERRVYADGVNLEGKTTYSDGLSGGSVIVDSRDASGTLLARSKHYFHGSPVNSLDQLPTEYPEYREGREYKTEAFASNGTTLLRQTTSTWQQRALVSWWTGNPDLAPPNDPRISEVVTALADTNQVSKRTFGYDDTVPFNNRNNVKEYDFNVGAPGNLLRETRTTFITSANYVDFPVHIRQLPGEVSVYDVQGTKRARTTFEYDTYNLDGPDCAHSFHCGLQPRASISGLDSQFTSTYTTRGNRTATTSYLLTNGVETGSIASFSHFDVAGSVVRVIDPRSTPSNIIATTIDYDDRFGIPDSEARSNSVPVELTGSGSFAFATKVTNPLGHTTYAQFDYYLGQPVNGEDANGVVASGYFNDLFDRRTQVRRGLGTAAESQTTFAYDDTNRIVTISSDLDASDDNVIVGKTLYDQLGRTRETRQHEGGSNYIVTETQYDALGRIFKTSNPFRPWQNETPVWTTTTYDALSRVLTVTTPDTAVVTTTYSGNAVTVTDQAQKKRKSVTDVLGRLIEVYEDPNGLNYQTTYMYDVLDNLVKVTQGSQQRFFMYDSLKRLIRARNPEQATRGSLALSDPITGNGAWSIGYQYDANGNLTHKTDPRGVVSTYAYDALNRNTTVNFSDTTTIEPDVKRFYDGATKGKGRFWYFYSGGDFANGANVDHTAVDSYDSMGRPLVQRQLFKLNDVWSAPYQTTRAYTLAGGVKTQTYPSGNFVTYNYDPAGRLGDKDAANLAFTGNLGHGGAPRTYARDVKYSSWGSLSREQYGTNTAVYRNLHYNIRGQLCDVRASNDGNNEWGGELGALVNYYSTPRVHCGSGTDNNGNVLMSQTIINTVMFEDRYTYDALNRLTAVSEFLNVTTFTGTQEYSYDRWGNRNITPSSLALGFNTSFEKEDATNRLYAPGDSALAETSKRIRYDEAGNQIKDTFTGYGMANFDAENHITSIQDNLGGWSNYTYNADGHRTRRKINNQETWQIYGMDGELLAEYAANAAAASPQKEYGYRNGQLLITAAANAGTAPAAGLIGHWKFDENSGTTAADSSGSNNTGTLASGATWATGQSGAATSLDGANDYVQVGVQSSLAMTSAASLSAWIYPTGPGSAAPDGGTIVNREGEYEVARFQDGTIRWAFANTNPGWNWINTGYVAPLNQWTHVAVVYASGVVKTYINGVLTHTYNGSGSIGDVTPTQNDFRIGGRQGPLQYFQGRIDEVRVYNRPLSANEVTTLLSPTSGLIGNWKFDENTGTTAADSSGNNNTGTLTSGATWAAGQSSSATNLDGVNDYVQVGAHTSLVMTSAASFSAWIYPTGPGSAAPDGGTIVNKEGEYEVARFQDGTIRWAFANTDPGWNWINTGYVAPLNQWTHVAVVYASGVVKTYINDVLTHTYNGSGSIGDITPTQNDFRIGGRQGPSQYFQGRIDEVRVYNRALSASEITTLFSTSALQINWLVSDHLGTPRMIIDQTGSLANVKRHDYLPFGEELQLNRTPGLGYGVGDGVRQQFTSYEGDSESGLDFAGARFYSHGQGRFTSVDPLMASAVTTNPQTFNRYSYVGNSPLTYIDPTGMFGINPAGGQGGIPLVSFDCQANEPEQQQPAQQPQIPIDIGEPPPPLVSTVTFVVPKPSEYINLPTSEGTFFTGVASNVEVTARDAAGNPITGILVAEAVVSVAGTEVKQTTEPHPVRPDGSFPDLVGVGLNPPPASPVSPERAADVLNRIAHRRTDQVTVQTLTFYAPAGYMLGRAVIHREFTNLDANDNVRPTTNASGRPVDNYSINVRLVIMLPPEK